MNWSSIVAIYILFWVLSAFLVMPFHVKTAHDTGDDIMVGHAESAPVGLKPKRILAWTTLLATTLFLIYYFVYTHNLLPLDMFDMRREALGQK